jgi:hypothetical protein
MMDILSERSKQEYPKSVTEILMSGERRCFINKIPMTQKPG